MQLIRSMKLALARQAGDALKGCRAKPPGRITGSLRRDKARAKPPEASAVAGITPDAADAAAGDATHGMEAALRPHGVDHTDAAAPDEVTTPTAEPGAAACQLGARCQLPIAYSMSRMQHLCWPLSSVASRRL